MDWGFLGIFKKADFNTLMFSIAITGWVMYYFRIDNYIFGLACIASIYCIARFALFRYQRHLEVKSRKKAIKQEQLAKEQNEKSYENHRKMEITRMFNGLSDYNKFQLSSLILKGEKDLYNYNVLHFQKLSNEMLFIDSLISVTEIFNDGFGIGDPTLSIREYADKIAVTIDPYLFELAKQYIENKSNQ
jgi:hypothetical protein